MRKQFSEALLEHSRKEEKLVLLTGDLGFMALEDLMAQMGARFINAGISEQNMVSMAASLAYDGFLPFLYSIAPFVVCRPFEQLRNETGLHNLPVKIVGNGGGYGYGIMGSTHHCLEDIALMRSIPKMEVFLPLYNEDIFELLPLMISSPHPNYLRLNNSSARPADVKGFAAIRKISEGKNGVIIGAGPVLLNAVQYNQARSLGYAIWSIDRIPFGSLPNELIEEINSTQVVVTLEEHYLSGGIGEMTANMLLSNPAINKSNLRFKSLHAHGYPSGLYGDQAWHQQENSIGGESLLKELSAFLSPNASTTP